MASVFKIYKGKRITSRDKNWSKGTWYFWGRLNGRAVQKALKYAQTKEEAELAAREIVRQAFDKRYGQTPDTDFADFANGTYTRYFEQFNTNVGAKRLYVETLVKAFKGKTLNAITPQDCRDVQAKLRKGTLSNSSVNRIMSTASKIFSLACEENILDRNPMQYVKSLKEPPPRNRLLTKEEKERLWRELEKDVLLMRLVTLAVNLPLRRGQLLAVTPDAVDLPNGVLLSTASKGRESRFVPLNGTAIHTLQTMMQNGELPFPLKDFRKRWSRALIAAKINKKGGKRGENFTFHDLRHVMATELTRKGVHSETIQRLYGHSDMKITQIYMNPEMADMADAVKRLDEVQETEGVQ